MVYRLIVNTIKINVVTSRHLEYQIKLNNPEMVTIYNLLYLLENITWLQYTHTVQSLFLHHSYPEEITGRRITMMIYCLYDEVIDIDSFL